MDHTGSTCWIRTPNGIRTRVTAVKGRGPRPLDDGGPVLLWTPVTRSAPQDLRKHTLPSPAAAKRQTSTWCDLGCIGSLIHCVPPLVPQIECLGWHLICTRVERRRCPVAGREGHDRRHPPRTATGSGAAAARPQRRGGVQRRGLPGPRCCPR